MGKLIAAALAAILALVLWQVIQTGPVSELPPPVEVTSPADLDPAPATAPRFTFGPDVPVVEWPESFDCTAYAIANEVGGNQAIADALRPHCR